MRIGIDGNEANTLKRVGISEYAFELIKGLSKYTQDKHQVTVYCKDEPMADFPAQTGSWNYKVIGPSKLWTQIGLPIHLFTQSPRPDVFFSPSHYAPRFSPIPTVISIMDLSYVYFSELFDKKDLYQLNHWTAYSARNATRVFTISESSKNDIIKYYQIPESKIIVTYPGIKDVFLNKDSILPMNTLEKKFGIAKKYILFVGTIQPRKNIVRLIEAFAEITRDYKEIDLVIVGKKGWLYESILEKPKSLGISTKVKFLDYVDNEDLESLYANAICYCLPSLYEGFGLPVLEAMQRGCPVLTSNVSSLPEAGGDAAIYVNPTSVSDIAQKLVMIITNPSLRNTMIEKGYKQVKKFSWDKTAKQTLAVLEDVVNKYER